MTKALGFNGVRLHQKVEDPRYLYWCDRLGLLVWGEMANAYVYSHYAVNRLISEWLEVLERDYSRPSAAIPGDVIEQMQYVQSITSFASAALESQLEI